jgi:hypothetical protein
LSVKAPSHRKHPFALFAHVTGAERWKGRYVSQAWAAKRHVPGGTRTVPRPHSKEPSGLQSPASGTAQRSTKLQGGLDRSPTSTVPATVAESVSHASSAAVGVACSNATASEAATRGLGEILKRLDPMR